MGLKDNSLLMLCHSYKEKSKISIAGWYASEKLDGQRAFWDGGITRGLAVRDVPWSNKYDARKQGMLSTGLWTRLGNVTHAPDWWLDGLPNLMLDGELWSGYNHRQVLMSAIKQEIPDNRWMNVQYRVYDMVPASRFLSTKTVTYSGRKQDISIPDWSTRFGPLKSISYGAPFLSRLQCLDKLVLPKHVKIHPQMSLPATQAGADEMINNLMATVLSQGGEGLVLKKPESIYECQRSHNCLKVKPFEDDEGIIVGWYSGKETDKGSKLLGMMGSLVLRLENGKELQLSGFTDEERALGPVASDWAARNPGAMTQVWGTIHFKLDQKISYKYRGLTADGIPMEARYWRSREDE